MSYLGLQGYVVGIGCFWFEGVVTSLRKLFLGVYVLWVFGVF